MKSFLALCILLTIFLSPAEGARAKLLRNLTCLSCHPYSPPNIGCTDRKDTNETEIAAGTGLGSQLFFRGQDVVHKCAMCAIEDTWSYKTKKFVGQRRKMCLSTNLTGPGCSYIFPVGTDYVMELCRCNTNKCNLRDITDLGGLKDIDKFPNPVEIIVVKKSRASQSHSVNCFWNWIVCLVISYFCAFHSN